MTGSGEDAERKDRKPESASASQRLAQSGAGDFLELVARKQAKLQSCKVQQTRNAAWRELGKLYV